MLKTSMRFVRFFNRKPQQPIADWAQLNRYHQENFALGSAENRVVFFGDSITDFWDLEAYFPGKPYINRGISGQTTPQLLIRLRRDAIALHPKIILCLAGTNDIAGNTGPMTLEMIQGNSMSIAELAQVHQIQMIFASLLPIHDYGDIQQSVSRPRSQIQALNQWLRSYCEANHYGYLDYYSAMVDAQGMLKAELSDDGLHPNRQGYDIMAPLAAAAIAMCNI